jgi:isopentenyldiphosphate isomerase
MKSNRIQIIAAVKRGELKGSLFLKWSLKNVSPKDVVFRDTHVLRDYSIFVKDQRGKLLSPTEKGQKILFEAGWVSHRTSVTIHPGQELVKEIVLTDLYNFRIGSVYTISVQRNITAEDGRTVEELRSNPVRAKIE